MAFSFVAWHSTLEAQRSCNPGSQTIYRTLAGSILGKQSLGRHMASVKVSGLRLDCLASGNSGVMASPQPASMQLEN